MAYQYKITLFTPTYNRAYIINRLYESIRRQTFRDFEWIVYDDGSTDNTEELVQQWINDKNDFPIRFYKGKNGGKCRATNRALEVADGEIFFTIDSDDFLTDDACEKINGWMESIRGLKDYCGIVANRGQTPTETRNTTWRDDPNCPWYQKPYRDATFLERYPEATEYPIDGERAEVFWTDIFKQYPYPEFEGENFITPCIPWNRMAHDGYKIRVFEDIIWIWEYLEDGLTIKGAFNRFYNNPQGYFLSHIEKAEFLKYPLKKRIKMYYNFYCDFHDKLTLKQIAEYSNTPILYYQVFKLYYSVRHR
ncbi:glycosyltransferase family 2 protein [Ruminococcus difficilis]|uniref:Glycosyltransferase family 2 protein n=1 Tax=Ruminococcus difficilis TaxID=2763069 RepID=A0A934U3A0_9FIRM|nr:glycosyltransferase family 2 protein [Ruminococcus difficilis]MBK6087609.1 glycosyltransferase family 2 protein [Ruminococcus difficilis]